MILGSYADLKIIKTRSVVQIVVEVPLERGKEVTDLFGLPQPNAEIPVVIARMKPEAMRANEQQQIAPPADERQPKPLSQIAAILCGIVAFRRFLTEEQNADIAGGDEAAEWLRKHCNIASRRDLDTNEIAAAKFKRLRDGYDVWMRAVA